MRKTGYSVAAVAAKEGLLSGGTETESLSLMQREPTDSGIIF